jgi:hypothetical protein
MRKILIFNLLMTALLFSQVCTAEEEHHRHHVALAGGIAWHDSKNSGFLGVDYVYRFKGPWTAGVFYEEVSGDFDVRALGLIIGRQFDSGWKIAAGPGLEYKINKDKTLKLFRVTTGYDWTNGNWTMGPIATADLIEGGEHTYYVGLAVGYGF